MAYKTEGDCPIAVGIMIRNQAKKESISIAKMIQIKSEESGIPEKTINRWVYPPKKSDPKNGVTPKPMKKHTKPETKKQLKNVAKEIESGNVSDDDIKVIDKATAKAISTGKAAKRVGTATATAVKKSNKGKGVTSHRPIDNYKRLDSNLKVALDGLTAWADGSMNPENESESEYAVAILSKASNIIIQFARLGADIEGIYNTFIAKGGKKNEEKQHNRFRLVDR